jgi:hypothetical protein
VDRSSAPSRDPVDASPQHTRFVVGARALHLLVRGGGQVPGVPVRPSGRHAFRRRDAEQVLDVGPRRRGCYLGSLFECQLGARSRGISVATQARIHHRRADSDLVARVAALCIAPGHRHMRDHHDAQLAGPPSNQRCCLRGLHPAGAGAGPASRRMGRAPSLGPSLAGLRWSRPDARSAPAPRSGAAAPGTGERARGLCSRPGDNTRWRGLAWRHDAPAPMASQAGARSCASCRIRPLSQLPIAAPGSSPGRNTTRLSLHQHGVELLRLQPLAAIVLASPGSTPGHRYHPPALEWQSFKGCHSLMNQAFAITHQADTSGSSIELRR